MPWFYRSLSNLYLSFRNPVTFFFLEYSSGIFLWSFKSAQNICFFCFLSNETNPFGQVNNPIYSSLHLRQSYGYLPFTLKRSWKISPEFKSFNLSLSSNYQGSSFSVRFCVWILTTVKFKSTQKPKMFLRIWLNVLSTVTKSKNIS